MPEFGKPNKRFVVL